MQFARREREDTSAHPHACRECAGTGVVPDTEWITNYPLSLAGEKPKPSTDFAQPPGAPLAKLARAQEERGEPA